MSMDMELAKSNLGHLSRKDNQSISSNHSGRSRSASHPAVESAVTRLLVAIKQLLEALTSWSQLKMDENQVSDVYVRLGNDFNAAVAAFSAFNIDMRELLSVPEDLRTVLEACLAEDATPENLERFLPTVRQIITNLLQGLRGKQSIYRRIVSEHRHKSDQAPGHERNDSRSSRSERLSRREGSHRSTASKGTIDGSDRPPERDSISRRSAQSSRRRDISNSQNTPPPPAPYTNGNGDERFVGGFAISPSNGGDAYTEEATTTPSNGQHRRQKSVPSVDSPSQVPVSLRAGPSTPPPSEPPPDTPPPVPASAVPAFIKRYSLVDKPMAPSSAPTVVVEPSSPDIQLDSQNSSPSQSQHQSSLPSPPPPPPPIPPSSLLAGPEQASLAALKKSDTLERRASKRFSSYNITRMTGGAGASREKSGRGGNNANRRSLLAAGSALTPGELAVLTEVDDDEGEPQREESPVAKSGSLRRDGSTRARARARKDHVEARASTPPPPLPRTPSKSPEPSTVATSGTPQVEPVIENGASDQSSTSDPTRIPVFLQLGREVKKVVIEPGLSFASLRMLFVDKFSYNPGLENFPAIYIQDPSSGVQYELEDVDEVKEKCLLSLNIEPLDQIKQHIDAQILTLSQDLKELRSAVVHNARSPPSPIIAHPLGESTPSTSRPTDKQFQNIARRLSRFVAHDAFPPSPPPPPPMVPQMTGQSLQPQMTGASVLSDYSSRVVTDLKTQFDEVQNLRRDLGIMRQLYTDFVKQTKESLGTLRTQTQSVKQLATTRVGGAREYIDTGKKRLDGRSQNVLTEVEKLQDTVEGIKDDVLKRHVTPKPAYLKSIKKDIENVATELTALREHMKTIKPMWKKTWAEELQNVVEEQHFLNHQEELLQDLLEDHKALSDVYGHVEKVISLRSAAPAKSRGLFRPPPPDENAGGVTAVMMEIRGAPIDPEKRMKAIEASQKNRQREMASRATSELHNELGEFVGQRKLKMTGGAEEAERVRKKRDEMTLKAMFSGGSATPPPGSPDIRAGNGFV
ncbi:Bud site selection protein 6 [Pleurotus pulmonarius]|nr:Bud site selection protein 6 [Pleurotus pulmonarius]KAF4594084.1 Bud site selection protein 6 [Pleurotus pulmonarius]